MSPGAKRRRWSDVETIDSVDPCTEYLTFGPWIYLVPQFKPRSVLMLGYGGGTTAGLMRLLYGNDFPITAVDHSPGERNYGVELHQEDARDFIRTAEHHEVIIVDLWDYQPPEFIFEECFAQRVASRCDYLIVHVMDDSDMSAYDHLPKVRELGLEYGARFHYYMINRIARAPFRGKA